MAEAVDPAAKFDPTTIAPGLAVVVGAWAAGRVLADRTRMLTALADTAAGIEKEREQLVERAGASGLHVDLEVTGDRASLGPPLEHTAYRVLQEALTNAAPSWA